MNTEPTTPLPASPPLPAPAGSEIGCLNRHLLQVLGLSNESANIVMREIERLQAEVNHWKAIANYHRNTDLPNDRTQARRPLSNDKQKGDPGARCSRDTK